MSAEIIDGRRVAWKIKQSLKNQITNLPRQPKLAIILVGQDKASLRYIKQKQEASKEIGAQTELIHLEKTVSQEVLEEQILNLNSDPEIHGIIVQLPLPEHLDKDKVVSKISKVKDVDGFVSDSPYKEAAAAGILELLHEYKVPMRGKTAVVLGSTGLVGAPTVKLLKKEGLELVEIDINTPPPIEPLVQKGDIVVSAVGKINLVTADMVKEAAVVIDAGINFNPSSGKLVGDVDFEKVKEKASLITPVPGGVGPMTVAMLMNNLVQAARRQLKAF